MNRLRSKAGETLVEVLCAVLVAGMGVAALAGLLSAAARLDREAAQASSKLYSCVNGAENPEAAVADGYPTEAAGMVPVAVEDGEAVNLPVRFYGWEDQVVSYRREDREADAP